MSPTTGKILGYVVDGAQALAVIIREWRERRRNARRGPKAILDEHGPLRATQARQRAHEAARRRGERDEP